MADDIDQRISALNEAIESLMVLNHELQANHAAAMQMLLRVISLTELKLKAGETPVQTYQRLKTVALEEIVLSLGEENPTLADEVQRVIDRVKGKASSGPNGE